MVRKIIYLLNPISGTKKKEKIKDLIIRKTRAKGIEFKILPSRADGHYEDLHAMIKKELITDVVICGGRWHAKCGRQCTTGCRRKYRYHTYRLGK
ncbi:MAG: diacylglycerol kinase family protein [Puia sp.]